VMLESRSQVKPSESRHSTLMYFMLRDCRDSAILVFYARKSEQEYTMVLECDMSSKNLVWLYWYMVRWNAKSDIDIDIVRASKHSPPNKKTLDTRGPWIQEWCSSQGAKWIHGRTDTRLWWRRYFILPIRRPWIQAWCSSQGAKWIHGENRHPTLMTTILYPLWFTWFGYIAWLFHAIRSEQEYMMLECDMHMSSKNLVWLYWYMVRWNAKSDIDIDIVGPS
jgi:hypothetical protein